jgi:hypothetical protein
VADGSSKRLQLHYEQGSRSLTDGLALRLLPDLAQVPDAAPDAPSDAAENSSPLWERLDVQALAGAATVLLLLTLLFVRRRRARRAEATAQLENSEAEPPTTQHCDADPTSSATTGPAPGRPLTIVFLDEEGGKASQQKLRLAECLSIGRDASADISLSEDEETSREHCELTFTEHRLVVRDLESSNGTWVNGIALPRGGVQHLDARDELRVGTTRLRVLLDEE